MRTDITLPAMDVNDTSALLFEYRFSNGDSVEAGQVLLNAEASKQVYEIAAPVSGFVLYLFEEGEDTAVGAPVAAVFDTEEAYNSHVPPQQPSAGSSPAPVLATEKAKKLAGQHKVDLADIASGGIIKEADVAHHLRKLGGKAKTPAAGPVFRYDKERIVIIGAGRGAQVLLDILADQPDKQVVLLVDDTVRQFEGYKVSLYGMFDFADKAGREEFDTAMISLSANRRSMKLRAKLFAHYRARGIHFANIIDKSANIRSNVTMGTGNIIGANVYIGTQTTLGSNNAISYGAAIGHHNKIGDCNLLAPGVILSGSVAVGSECIVPAGVNFLNGVKIGSNVVLPVGYNVSENIGDNTFI